MTDIVEQLRNWLNPSVQQTYSTPEEVMDEAADEIELLRKERDGLREEVKRYKPVLLDIVHQYPEEDDVEEYWYWRAREALQMKDGE